MWRFTRYRVCWLQMGVQLSQRGFKLGLKGEGGITQLTRDEPRCGMLVSGVKSTAQLKCVCTNACSTGIKQEKLEAIVQQDSYDLVAVTETWWDSSHDWNVVIDGYTLFRKDRPTRRGGGITLCVSEQSEHIELCLGADEEQVESLWVRIKGQPHKGDITVAVCYRPPDQEEEVDEAFYRQLKVASQSQALVLMGDFNHPDISWEDHTARHMQSRRFLQSIDDNFLMQTVEEPKGEVICWTLY